MAGKKANTARKYESQFTAAVEQGFAGTYGEFAKIQSSPAQKKVVTGRKYDVEFDTAVAAGYTGTYTDYVRTLNNPEPTKKRIEELKPRELGELKGPVGATTSELKAISDNVERIAEHVGESLSILQNWELASACVNEDTNSSAFASMIEEPIETHVQRENRLREERRQQMNHRYGRHQVIQNVTMNVMRGYVPNFSQLPSGYILAVHRETGTIHPFYFRLYSNLDLNPKPPEAYMNGQFGGQRTMHNGPGYDGSETRSGRGHTTGFRNEDSRMEAREGWNEVQGLENYGVSPEYMHLRISEIANSLFNDDVFFCQTVHVGPTYPLVEQPLRLMHQGGQYSSKEQDKLWIGGLMEVTLEEFDDGGYNSGYESNVRVYFPGVEKDVHKLFRLKLAVPFPEKFVATECSAHMLAREIARRLAYAHPAQIGRGVVILELGGEFTKHESRIAEVVL